MLLRRITGHIKAQNWTAVALDFVIVVVGVFIGIQVSNWNTALQNKKLEQQYLARLYADMVGSLEDYKENLAWDVERLHAQDVVIQALEAGTLLDEDRDSFTRGLIFLGLNNRVARRWGTVEELKSTGSIALIDDLPLRELIAKADASYSRVNEINGTLREEIIRSRARLTDRFRPTIPAFDTGDPVAAVFDFEALIKDEEFLNVFASADLRSQTIVQFNRDFLRDLTAICDHLADRLGEERCEKLP